MQFRIPFLLLILCFLTFQSIAQPETETAPHYGCHHAHHQIPLEPLTNADKAYMAASAARSDTMDILDYAITLKVVNFSQRHIEGFCKITFTPKMDNIDYISLDLLELNVDSISANGQNLNYDYDGLLLHVNLPSALNAGDIMDITVYYNGTPVVDPSNFGGFAFAGGYAYNLGIGLTSNPHNFGRSWYPCFDNFVERSTYEYNIITGGNNKAYCVGTFIEDVDLGDNLRRRTYRMDQQIPTYLSSVAISTYAEYNAVHEGVNDPVPIQLVAKTEDIADMESTFIQLGDAIDALEFWYGPYQWERVGYVATPVGAMEHPTNIAYPTATATSGNTFGHRNLMAHELAHCWWGDYVTVGSAMDMWVKEGNAEYGAHLMTEYAFGHEAFIDQVKDNFMSEVLSSAHVDDEGYRALSGMPHEFTYGTHTYRKGASMLHNMRGYLGDDLFKQGQRAVLDAFQYASADAIQYRDKLTEATGYDMTPFFNDWILNPGYSAFEINDVEIAASGEVLLEIEQKVLAAPELHTDVPLEITLTSNVGEKYTERVMASGAMTSIAISAPFTPSFITINENNVLNMAHLSDQLIIEETGSKNLPYSDFTINTENVEAPVLLHVDHYWVAPDPIQANPSDARISNSHYWRVAGDLPETFEAAATLEYNTFFDSDLVSVNEDSLILVYRAYPTEDWKAYPHYSKLTLIPTDGNGFIKLSKILPGEYAFANGELETWETTNTNQLAIVENQVELFPNPTTDSANITIKNAPSTIKMQLIATDGKILVEEKVSNINKDWNYELDLQAFTSGVYWLKFSDDNDFLIDAQAVEILR